MFWAILFFARWKMGNFIRGMAMGPVSSLFSWAGYFDASKYYFAITSCLSDYAFYAFRRPLFNGYMYRKSWHKNKIFFKNFQVSYLIPLNFVQILYILFRSLKQYLQNVHAKFL